MRRAGYMGPSAAESGGAKNVAGYRPEDAPLPPVDDQGLGAILSRAASDPHVDVVVMHREKCSHCKPELRRVAAYVRDRADVSGWATEIDQAPGIDRLRALLLDDDWSSPATGYFQGGKLRLLSPDRRVPVGDLVRQARSHLLVGRDKIVS